MYLQTSGLKPMPVMTTAGQPALVSAPIRPRQTQRGGVGWQRQRHIQQPPHFRHCYARQFCSWSPPFAASVLRMAASHACASIDNVICRYQLVQCRTS